MVETSESAVSSRSDPTPSETRVPLPYPASAVATNQEKGLIDLRAVLSSRQSDAKRWFPQLRVQLLNLCVQRLLVFHVLLFCYGLLDFVSNPSLLCEPPAGLFVRPIKRSERLSASGGRFEGYDRLPNREQNNLVVIARMSRWLWFIPFSREHTSIGYVFSKKVHWEFSAQGVEEPLLRVISEYPHLSNLMKRLRL